MGFDITTTMLVHAVDVSYTAFQMCYLQLAFRGVPALVVRGNSLSMEVFESMWTPAAIKRFYPHHGHLNFSKPSAPVLMAIIPVGGCFTHREATFRYPMITEHPVIKNYVQLELF